MTNKVTIEEAKEIQLSEIAELKKEVAEFKKDIADLKLLNGHWKEKWESRSREVVSLKTRLAKIKKGLQGFFNNIDKPKPYSDMRDIQESVCAYFAINFTDLIGHSQVKAFIDARHIAMYLCRLQGRSYPDIGKAFGNRDHTSIIHAVKKVETREDLKQIAQGSLSMGEEQGYEDKKIY